MINIFTLDHGRLVNIQPEEITTRKPIWVDISAPSDDERAWVSTTFSITLPHPEHLRDIESSARFYEENEELHVRSDFLRGKEIDSRSVPSLLYSPAMCCSACMIRICRCFSCFASALTDTPSWSKVAWMC